MASGENESRGYIEQIKHFIWFCFMLQIWGSENEDLGQSQRQRFIVAFFNDRRLWLKKNNPSWKNAKTRQSRQIFIPTLTARW